MIDPLDKEINIDEIMERIREEVKRRKKLPAQETFQETEQLPPNPIIIKDNHNAKKNSYDHFLWKYGRRYKKIIKAVPILKNIAKKQHSRLARQSIHSQPVTQQSLPNRVDIDVLPYYINYHGFLVQVREEEGLKGRIKSFLFKFIRFFAWWQEQINRALYQELMSQKAKMDERDRWVQELHNQQINRLMQELSGRDKMIEDLNNKFIFLSQVKDELSRELGDQRVKIGETESNLEGLLHQQSAHLGGELAERDKVIESLNNRLIQFGRVEEELNQGMEDLKFEFTGAHKSLREEIESTKKELSGLLEIKSAINYMTEEMRNHKLEILDQKRRLALLPEEAQEQIKDILKEENHLPDTMYVAFEDRFRGTREEIKERLRIYLPYIKEANIETSSSPILDLGCGRGEWLELLKENGYIAKGVDFNRVMVRQCQEFGLDVIESDIIEYLRNQQPNSLSAITGFHILEHLSLKTIISLFDEALRILKSGGIAIFETPNPENLIVASCNFYLDPTHRNPIPPRLLNFLIESRGFNKTEIVRLHPNTFFREGQKTSTAVKSLISLFNKEQDYSIIAYKE